MNYVQYEKPLPGKTDIHEWAMINGRYFNGFMTLSKRFGSASAIGGGRILELLLTENDNVVAYWKDGKWIIPIPDLDPEVYLAYVYFVRKYNRVISEREEREIYVHGN